MHYGAFIFGTGYSVRMDDLAVELESRGLSRYSSLSIHISRRLDFRLGLAAENSHGSMPIPTIRSSL